jgi:GT2 family glycosyltransferase
MPITLLVPCYNAARFLPRLAASVRAQTAPFADVVCYDDASSDDTVRVAAELGLRIVRGETNRGPAFARNRLLEAAREEWVHFHDADDLLDPHFVEQMSAVLSPEVDVAVCQMDWVTESSGGLEIAWRYDGAALARDPVEANLTNPIGVIACVFRRAKLEAVGGFNESLRTWEDADLQVRLAQAGARYRVVPAVLATGLRHQFGASANVAQLGECRIRQLEDYAERLPSRYRPTIAAEAEKVGVWLLTKRTQRETARRCVALCRRLGWKFPSTRHPLMRAARALLPAAWVVRLQARHRRSRR